MRNAIIDTLRDQFLYIIVDESTSNGKQICNMLVGVLSADGPQKALLVASKEIEDTKAETITAYIDENFSMYNLELVFGVKFG